jgi:trk system potassium uptake protein TrkA
LCAPSKPCCMVAMHVIVVGCGRVGSELAVSLDQMGHSVAIIDKNRNAFRKLPDRWSGRAVLGFGFDRDHLEQAGVGEATALAAVTSGDNTNVLSARIARETFQIPNVVARIYDPRRAVIYQRLGIPTVATVRWTTDQVLRRLLPDESVAEWTDAGGSLSLVERPLPESWAGKKLIGLDQGAEFRLTAITRAGEARIVGPDIVGQEGDLLHVMVRKEALGALEERLAAGHEGGH